VIAVPLVIVGAGGFGREALDVVEAINDQPSLNTFDVLGVLDAMPSPQNLSRLAARGLPWLGTPGAWLNAGEEAQYLIGIGDPSVRQSIAEEFERAGVQAATVVHPGASIGSAIKLGEGSVICGGVHISTNVTIGRHVHVNPNATIGHDVVVNDFVSINPASIVSGDVSLGARTLIGAGAIILQGLSIGAQSVVGAAACVTRDVGSARTVKGVPAR
jgi:sugar O-acyltransferase (sialic acid O-acetyltransferase NeuD family)